MDVVRQLLSTLQAKMTTTRLGPKGLAYCSLEVVDKDKSGGQEMPAVLEYILLIEHYVAGKFDARALMPCVPSHAMRCIMPPTFLCRPKLY
jgi:hypothetical protein